MLWESPTVGYTGTCTHAIAQRTQTDPTDSGNRVVYVYVLPQGTAGDLKWDVPKFCSDGQILRSPIHGNYRNSAIWLARETDVSGYPASQRRRRWNPASKTYTNGANSKTLNEVVFIPDSRDIDVWNCYEPSTKLAKLEILLGDEGLDNPNYKYVVILHAKQKASCTESVSRYVVGRGQVNDMYSYSLIYLPTVDPDTYVRGAYGCANRYADPIPQHELTHQVGAVDHLTTCCRDDLMYQDEVGYGSPTANSLTTNTGAQEMRFDQGAAHYRDEALTDSPWDTDGSDYLNNSYKLCF